MAVVSNPYTFSITSNKTVRVNISRKTYTVTLGPANTQYDWYIDNSIQCYNFTYKDPDTGTSTTKKVVNDTVTLTLKYGTTWTAKASLNNTEYENWDYVPGTLSASSGTITGALNITCTNGHFNGGK